MSEQIKVLQEKLASLVHEQRDMLNSAKDNLDTLDSAKMSKIEGDMDKVELLLQSEQRQIEREERLNKPVEGKPIPKETGETVDEKEKRHSETFRNFLRKGLNGVDFEARTIYAGSDADGGYLQAPIQFAKELLREIDNVCVVRQLATKKQTGKAEGLGIYTKTDSFTDATWTSELKTGDMDETVVFGKKELRTHPLAKGTRLSNKLIQVATVADIEGEVLRELAKVFGQTEEQAFMTGDGNMKPLGLFTASDDGISTSRDVSTGNKATEVTFDGFIEFQHKLHQNYWTKAKMLFHLDLLKQLRKIKDNNGQYIWQQGMVSVGIPSSIYGSSYVLGDYVPNTFTTGKYVAIYGDFSQYYIADCMAMQMQVLKELYALTNQTGYICRQELDGMPVVAKAFARMQLA